MRDRERVLTWAHLTKQQATAIEGHQGTEGELRDFIEDNTSLKQLCEVGCRDEDSENIPVGREGVRTILNKLGHGSAAENAATRGVDEEVIRKGSANELSDLLGLTLSTTHNLINIFKDRSHTDVLLHPPIGSSRRVRLDILIDFFVKIVHFCRQNSFSARLLSTLWSIAYEVHTLVVLNKDTLKSSYGLFMSLMLIHSTRSPPYATKVFEPNQKTMVENFFSISYYQQYKMYLHVFIRVPLLTVTSVLPSKLLNLSQPSQPIPLSAAVEEEVWNDRQAVKKAEETTAAFRRKKEQRQLEEAIVDEKLQKLKVVLQDDCAADVNILEQRLAALEASYS